MSLPNLVLDSVSDELALKAAKVLYLKEDAGVCSSPGNGGLASASDIGQLPNPALGGRVAKNLRKDKMKSEENIDAKIPMADMQTPTVPPTPTQDTGASADDGDTPAPTSDANSTNESIVRRYTRMFEEATQLGCPRTDLKYMVSWLNPKPLEKLHVRQAKMANGMFYVVFDTDAAGTAFYTDLKNRGIDNLKIDVL